MTFRFKINYFSSKNMIRVIFTNIVIIYISFNQLIQNINEWYKHDTINEWLFLTIYKLWFKFLFLFYFIYIYIYIYIYISHDFEMYEH